jgi:hypothetical protein
MLLLNTSFQKFGNVFLPDRSLWSRLGTKPHTEPRPQEAVSLEQLAYL